MGKGNLNNMLQCSTLNVLFTPPPQKMYHSITKNSAEFWTLSTLFFHLQPNLKKKFYIYSRNLILFLLHNIKNNNARFCVFSELCEG